MPEQIQGMAVSQALGVLFATQGKLGLQLDDMVVPVVNVGDLAGDAYGPLALGHISVGAGGVGTRSMAEISLPQVGSAVGGSARLERMWIAGMVAGQVVRIAPSPGLPAPNVAGFTAWADVRSRGLPAVQIVGRNNAASIPATDILLINGNNNGSPVVTEVDLKGGWIIGEHPDTGLQQGLMLKTQTDNEILRVNFLWREKLPR